MAVAEEAAMGRQRRRVGRGEDEVARGIDRGALLLCVRSPKHVYEVLSLGVEATDDGVGERLPTMPLMRSGTVRADGQDGVEQQHALIGPTREIAARGARSAEVVGDLFEDVLKRGGKGRAVLHREAEPVRLAGLVVGVLTDDDHLDAVEGTVRKGVEDVRSGGIDRRLAVLLAHEIGQFHEIVFLKFAGQTRFPARLHFYVHVVGLLGKL